MSLEPFYTSLVAQYLEPVQTAYLIEQNIVQYGQSINLSGVENPLTYIRRFPRNTILDLNLSRCGLTSEQLHQILFLQQNIQRLNIYFNMITDLSPLPNLTYLDISYNQRFSGVGLSNSPELIFLNLNECDITDQRFNEIETLTQLQTLTLSLPEWKQDTPFTGDFSNLLVLKLDAATDINLSKIRHFQRLEYVGVVGNNITDIGVAYLQRLPNLRMLDAAETLITGLTLSRLVQLTHLNVSFTETMHYDHLQHLVNLRALSIDDERPEGEQNLDPDLAFLTPMTKLQFLDLNSAMISDDGFKVLSRLPLRFLQLSYVNINADAMMCLSEIHTLEILYLDSAVFENKQDLALLRPPNLRILGIYAEEPVITDDTVDLLFGLRLSDLNANLEVGEAGVLSDVGIERLISAGVIPDTTRIYSREDIVSVSQYLHEYPQYTSDIMTFLQSRWKDISR